VRSQCRLTVSRNLRTEAGTSSYSTKLRRRSSAISMVSHRAPAAVVSGKKRDQGWTPVGPPRAKEIRAAPANCPSNALPQSTALQLGSTTISKKSDGCIDTHHKDRLPAIRRCLRKILILHENGPGAGERRGRQTRQRGALFGGVTKAPTGGLWDRREHKSVKPFGQKRPR